MGGGWRRSSGGVLSLLRYGRRGIERRVWRDYGLVVGCEAPRICTNVFQTIQPTIAKVWSITTQIRTKNKICIYSEVAYPVVPGDCHDGLGENLEGR